MKRKILNKNLESTYYPAVKKAGVFSLTLLVAITAVSMFSPAGGSHAVEDAEVGVGVGSTINLSIDTDKISLSGAPNTFVSGDLTATVTTNSAFGYTLNLQDADNSTDLEHETTSAAFTSNFEGSKTEETIADNSWGFSTDASSYHKIPAYGSPVAVRTILSTLKTENDVSTITIGAKIGINSASGKYSDNLLLTAYTNGVDDFDGYDEMQGFSCDNLEIGDSAPFRDDRDGNVYMVTKLKDGQCWMTTSLRIQNAVLTGEDSDLGINDTFLLRPSHNYSEASSHNSYTLTFDMLSINRTTGGYYSYYTTTAGTFGFGQTEPDNIAKHSICPKGWRLPVGGSGGDFDNLNNYYTAEQIKGAPVHLEQDGRYYGSFDSGAGYYWSSKLSGNYAYIAYINHSGSLNLSSETNNMQNGNMIRCIARSEEQPSEQKINPLDYPTLQDFTCGTLANNTSTTLRDSRDNQLYKVAKLADGKCWMTQNLNLNNYTLTKEDSDITADSFVLPNNNWLVTYNFTDKNTAPFVDYSNNKRVGTFYNYTAATAGTISGNVTEEATSSVCPKNWKLPSQSDFESLLAAYPNSNGLKSVPILNFGSLGYGYIVDNQSSPNYINDTIFWSSSAWQNTSGVRGVLQLSGQTSSSDYVRPSSQGYGYNIRCIKR